MPGVVGLLVLVKYSTLATELLGPTDYAEEDLRGVLSRDDRNHHQIYSNKQEKHLFLSPFNLLPNGVITYADGPVDTKVYTSLCVT